LLAVLLLAAGGAFAAELPSRREAHPAKPQTPRSCEIDGEPGFPLGNDGCLRIGGYVTVGVTAGNLKPH
jgi:hypothetical protein